MRKKTDNSRTKKEINISEIRYRRLFETTKDGILILDAGTGSIIDVNPYLIEMLEYTKEEFVDKKLWEIGPFKDILRSKISFEELQNKEYIRYDNLPLETKTGKRIEFEFISNVYKEGNQKVIQCNIRDNSARKLAEELSAKQQEQQEQFTENEINKKQTLLNEMSKMAKIGGWEFDVQKQTLIWSDETFVLYERDPKLGYPSPEEEALYYSPEQAKILGNYAAQAIVSGQGFSYDLEVKLPGGKTAYFYAIMRPIKDANGQVVKLSGTVQDITDHRKIEIELRQLGFHYSRRINITRHCTGD